MAPPRRNTRQTIPDSSQEPEENAFEDDPDLNDLQDPEMEDLEEAPLLGGQAPPSTLFGDTAETVGRPTSPLLWAEAASMPTITRFRVWKLENGEPVSIGSISSTATEDHFVMEFYDAMPQKGQKSATFRLRPVDTNGKGIGKEITKHISEHHRQLAAIRASREAAAMSQGWPGMPNMNMNPAMMNMFGGMNPMNGMNGMGMGVAPDNGISDLTAEAGRAWEAANMAAQTQTAQLQQSLEEERNRVREAERLQAEERIRLAEKSASSVEALSNRMLEMDRTRSAEVLEANRSAAAQMMQMLTTTFQQSQTGVQTLAEQQRLLDERRAQQERQTYERMQREAEERRAIERAEAAERMSRERAEAEERRRRDREEDDRRRREQEVEWTRRMEQTRLEAIERQKAEEHRLELLRLELQASAEKTKVEAELRERRAREDAERQERLRKEELEREREFIRLREDRIAREAAIEREREREHQNRLAEAATRALAEERSRIEAREKAEREAREMAERERQRQHELQLREMEMNAQRDREYQERRAQQDREHQERIVQMQKAQNSGGLSGLGDLLGMDTPDLLSRIFGGGNGGEESASWVEAIPKSLAAVAEMGKAFAAVQQKQVQQQQRPQLTNRRPTVVTAPDGSRLLADTTAQPMPPTQVPMPAPMPALMSPPPQPARPRQLIKEPVVSSEKQESTSTSPVPTTTVVSTPVNDEKDLTEIKAKLQDARKRVKTYIVAKKAGISVDDQKKARDAFKELFSKAKKTPETEWSAALQEVLLLTPSLLPYLQSVSLYAALVEAHVPPEMCLKLVRMLDSVKELHIRTLVPFDADDLEKFVQAKQQADEQAATEALAEAKTILKEEEGGES